MILIATVIAINEDTAVGLVAELEALLDGVGETVGEVVVIVDGGGADLLARVHARGGRGGVVGKDDLVGVGVGIGGADGLGGTALGRGGRRGHGGRGGGGDDGGGRGGSRDGDGSDARAARLGRLGGGVRSPGLPPGGGLAALGDLARLVTAVADVTTALAEEPALGRVTTVPLGQLGVPLAGRARVPTGRRGAVPGDAVGTVVGLVAEVALLQRARVELTGSVAAGHGRREASGNDDHGRDEGSNLHCKEKMWKGGEKSGMEEEEER